MPKEKLEFSVKDALYDVEQQRTIMGLLVERLGGSVTITQAQIEASYSAQGIASLHVAFNPEMDTVTISVVLDKPVGAPQ